MNDTLHPITRFRAPSTIIAGSPLKKLISASLVRLISDSLANVVPEFERRSFEEQATHGLEALELSAMGEHIARAMGAHLPRDYPQAAMALVASLGPELTRTEGNGLAPFFYFPHAYFVSQFGLGTSTRR
jgi:hypothetical protein